MHVHILYAMQNIDRLTVLFFLSWNSNYIYIFNIDRTTTVDRGSVFQRECYEGHLDSSCFPVATKIMFNKFLDP